MAQVFNQKMRFSIKKKNAEDPLTDLNTWGSIETFRKHLPTVIVDAMKLAESNQIDFFRITLLLNLEEWTVSNF